MKYLKSAWIVGLFVALSAPRVASAQLAMYVVVARNAQTYKLLNPAEANKELKSVLFGTVTEAKLSMSPVLASVKITVDGTTAMCSDKADGPWKKSITVTPATSHFFLIGISDFTLKVSKANGTSSADIDVKVKKGKLTIADSKETMKVGETVKPTAKLDDKAVDVTWAIQDADGNDKKGDFTIADGAFSATAKKTGHYKLKATYKPAGESGANIDDHSFSDAEKAAASLLQSETADLEVNMAPGNVTFVPQTLVLGSTVNMAINIVDANGAPVKLTAQDLANVAVSTDHEDIVTAKVFQATASEGISVELHAIAPGEAHLVVTGIGGIPAGANGESGKLVSKNMVGVGRVVGFKPVLVQLNVMDDQTVSHTFGEGTRKMFYAVSVRIYNNLKDDPNGTNLGKSILAYSSSIATHVGLEKEWDPRLHSDDSGFFPDAKKARQADPKVVTDQATVNEIRYASTHWTPVTESDLAGTIQRAQFVAPDPAAAFDSLELGNVEGIAQRLVGFNFLATYSGTSAVAKAQVDSLREKQKGRMTSPELADASLVLLNGLLNWNDLAKQDALKGTSFPTYMQAWIGKPTGNQTLQINRFLLTSLLKGVLSERRPYFVYRPYTGELMYASNPSREEMQPREQKFQAFGVGLSAMTFLNSVGVFKGGAKQTIDTILSQTSSNLLPALRAFFPNLAEVHRQNLVRFTMGPTEEVPFGGDVTRIVFFPKGEFRGVKGGYKFRISEIDTSFFSIEVAVIDKLKAPPGQNLAGQPGGTNGGGGTP